MIFLADGFQLSIDHATVGLITAAVVQGANMIFRGTKNGAHENLFRRVSELEKSAAAFGATLKAIEVSMTKIEAEIRSVATEVRRR